MSGERRCVVVGAGLLGLSAAWALSGRGWSVRVLEAGGAVGHERCGSKGDARIFRLGYREARYVEMAVLARDLWRSLESSTGRSLLRMTGQLSFGTAAAVEEVAGALAAHGVPGSWVGADLNGHADAVATAMASGIVTHGPVLFEPESGVLAADACLAALITAGGVAVETCQAVRALEESGDGAGVSVVLDDGASVAADVVVVCAGPASLGLLEGLGGRGEASEGVGAGASLPQVAYFRAREDEALPPVFIEWGDDMVYGLPVGDAGPHAGLFKMSHHAPGAVLERYDPTETAPLPDDGVLLGDLREAAERLVPNVDPRPVATERCVYDNTTDTDFVLDRVGPVVVGCGTSGHGFKFGPLLGQVLADLAEDVTPPIDLAPFRLGRPAGGDPA